MKVSVFIYNTLFMLKTLLNFIYFTFIILFIFLLFIKEKLVGNFNNQIIISYFIILLPLFDYLLDYLRNDLLGDRKINFVNHFRSKFLSLIKEKIVPFFIKIRKFFIKNIISKKIFNILKYIFVKIYEYKKIMFGLLLLLLTLKIAGTNVFSFLTFVFLVFSVYLKIDSRVSFFIALILLVITPLLLILEKNQIAESFSIYAYYFLVIGVIVSISENIEIRFNFINKIKSLSSKIFKKLLNLLFILITFVSESFYYIKLNYNVIFYDLIFVFFVFFIASFYYAYIYDLLINSMFFVFGIYILFKFLGFSFDLNFQKINLIDKKNINYFIMFISIYIIIFSSLFKNSTYESKNLFLVLSSGVSFILFLIFFTDILELLEKIIMKNIYLSLSFSLGIILILSNIYFEDLQKLYVPIETKKEVVIVQEEIKNDIKKEEVIKTTPEVVEIKPEIIDKPEPIVFDISMFDENLFVGMNGEKVGILQNFLYQYGYYNFEINSSYDENTKIAMAQFLTEKCGWKSTNKGALGPLAREECLKGFLQK